MNTLHLIAQAANACIPAGPAATLVVPCVFRARGAVVPAARDWRGNSSKGRKAYSCEGANSYG